MMSAPASDLAPPLSTPYTPAQLAVFNGVPEGQKIYVAIKGTIFDVSAKPEMYGPGKSYNVFAGRDASKALGMSSVKIEDATADYSSLSEKELGTLQSWFTFFEKRYNVVGKVVE
ncbi:progesterone binding protein [Mrakia frigida]|uniref:progesterone binding protein n=1 Tax=Mrakia frigida TaxID=29902 RepID=UPI003FCBF948